MQNEIILSICIPTYNRKERVEETVYRLLSSDLDEIEICVVDNASEDGTYIALQNIKDNRLKLFENEKNIGQFPNQYKALFYGTGKYVVTVMDRDEINIKNLRKLLRYLKTLRYDAILSTPYFIKRNMVLNKKNSCYTWTIGSHPSYMVIKREILVRDWTYEKLMKIDQIINNIEYVVPWTATIMTESYWDKRILFMPTLCWVRENALGTTPYYSGKRTGNYLYYMPESGLVRLRWYCHLNAKKITGKDRSIRNLSIYASELIRSTILVYDHTRRDSHMRIRYGFRHVKKQEYYKANKELCQFMIKDGISHKVIYLSYYYKVLLLFALNKVRMKIIIENKKLGLRSLVKKKWEKLSYEEIYL